MLIENSYSYRECKKNIFIYSLSKVIARCRERMKKRNAVPFNGVHSRETQPIWLKNASEETNLSCFWTRVLTVCFFHDSPKRMPEKNKTNENKSNIFRVLFKSVQYFFAWMQSQWTVPFWKALFTTVLYYGAQCSYKSASEKNTWHCNIVSIDIKTETTVSVRYNFRMNSAIHKSYTSCEIQIIKDSFTIVEKTGTDLHREVSPSKGHHQ